MNNTSFLVEGDEEEPEEYELNPVYKTEIRKLPS